MLPSIDQPLVVLVSGIVLSVLEMTGYVSPSYHSQNLSQTEIVVGGIFGAIVYVSWFIHHTAVKNQKLALGIGSSQKQNNSFFATLFSGLKGFIVTGNQGTVASPAQTAS